MAQRDAEIDKMRGWLGVARNSESYLRRKMVTENRGPAGQPRLPIGTLQPQLIETEINSSLGSELAALDFEAPGSRMEAE